MDANLSADKKDSSAEHQLKFEVLYVSAKLQVQVPSKEQTMEQ